MKICFFLQAPGVRLRNRVAIKAWIEHSFSNEKKEAAEVSVVLVTDKFLSRLNKEYLTRDTLTDIIAFNLNEPGMPIEGELYISIDRVRENAGIFNVPAENELHRVIIHGMLHLMGYDDSTAIQKMKMKAREDYYLKKLAVK